MTNRQKSREAAVQTLYAWDAQGTGDVMLARKVASDASGDVDVQNDAMQMAQGAWDSRDTIDAWVVRLAPQWPTRRQPAVDRAIIRLGVWELAYTDTPPKVAIDQAIELAKDLSTENSPAFVNGVLDAVLQEIRTLGALPSILPADAAEALDPAQTPDATDTAVATRVSPTPATDATEEINTAPDPVTPTSDGPPPEESARLPGDRTNESSTAPTPAEPITPHGAGGD